MQFNCQERRHYLVICINLMFSFVLIVSVVKCREIAKIKVMGTDDNKIEMCYWKMFIS